MSLPVRQVLFGSEQSLGRRYVSLSLAVVLFMMTFVAYALDFFQITGGVVFIPGHAALVGVLGAALIGYRDNGLVVSWVVAYGPLLGYNADHSFLGLSGRSFLERTAAFVTPDGLVFLGIEAVILGTLGFLFGVVCRLGVGFFREGAEHPDAR